MIDMPALELVGDGEWRLIRPYKYVTLNGFPITVPLGFLTDGASTPFGILIEPWGGHYAGAALVHDYLYVCINAGKPHITTRGKTLGECRKKADAIFLEIAKRAGVRPLVRFSMWLAVRAFGANPIIKAIAIR
jgi:hypothetical protein